MEKEKKEKFENSSSSLGHVASSRVASSFGSFWMLYKFFLHVYLHKK